MPSHAFPAIQAIHLNALSAKHIQLMSESHPNLRKAVGHVYVHTQTESFLVATRNRHASPTVVKPSLSTGGTPTGTASVDPVSIDPRTAARQPAGTPAAPMMVETDAEDQSPDAVSLLWRAGSFSNG
ncbi:uncharacterized protein AB675_4009 [Cyphellophora attinorum]|uniref:Uncharacterized protein n=1 Tax=Cyphellophora attinorum TaxID=1664694 RepID=A0A0N1NZG8_9EURO|nr:uncharacterized protein AB675_4009 [Phialophora attinorum]KPI37596.1 hypothetical protein AB675_4009 [Phialophora attinorum]